MILRSGEGLFGGKRENLQLVIREYNPVNV
jgi:hypothetical protein